jgi:hypothetical protein
LPSKSGPKAHKKWAKPVFKLFKTDQNPLLAHFLWVLAHFSKPKVGQKITVFAKEKRPCKDL